MRRRSARWPEAPARRRTAWPSRLVLARRFLQQARDSFIFLPRQRFRFEQGGNRAGQRPVEEGSHHVRERGCAHILLRRRRPIDIAKAVLLVAQIALALEVPQHPANAGVSRAVRQVGANLRRGRAAAPVDDLDDLALTPAKFAGYVARQSALSSPNPYANGLTCLRRFAQADISRIGTRSIRRIDSGSARSCPNNRNIDIRRPGRPGVPALSGLP